MTDWSSYDSADVAEMEMAGNTWITLGSIDVSIPLDDKIEHPVNKIGCSAKVNLKVFFQLQFMTGSNLATGDIKSRASINAHLFLNTFL